MASDPLTRAALGAANGAAGSSIAATNPYAAAAGAALGAMSGGPSSASATTRNDLFGGGLGFQKSINFQGEQSTGGGLPAGLPWPLLAAAGLVLLWRKR